jgi:hypothetical protein
MHTIFERIVTAPAALWLPASLIAIAGLGLIVPVVKPLAKRATKIPG